MCGWYYDIVEEMEEEERIMNIENTIKVLEAEIKHIDKIAEPEDCGHMFTSKSWMEHRIRQLKGLPEED